MQHYIVQVWKTENRNNVDPGVPDYEEKTDAYTPAEAAKNILAAKQVSSTFYIEVCLKQDEISSKGQPKNCWVYTDESTELKS